MKFIRIFFTLFFLLLSLSQLNLLSDWQLVKEVKAEAAGCGDGPNCSGAGKGYCSCQKTCADGSSVWGGFCYPAQSAASCDAVCPTGGSSGGSSGGGSGGGSAPAVCTYNQSFCYGNSDPYYYCDALNHDNCCITNNTCGGYCYLGCSPGNLFSCTGSTPTCVAACEGATPNFIIQSGDGTTISDWGVALNTRTIRLTAGGCDSTVGYVFDMQRYDAAVGWVPFFSRETTSNSVTVDLPAGTGGIAHYTTGVHFTNGGHHVARDFFVSDVSFNTPEKISDNSYRLSWHYIKYNRVGTNPMNFKVKIGSQEYDVDENLGTWNGVDPTRYIYRYTNNVTLNLPPGGSYTWGVNVQQGSFPTSGTTYAPPSMSFSTTPTVFGHGVTKFYSISGNVFLDNTYTNSKGAQPNFTAAPVSINVQPAASAGPTPAPVIPVYGASGNLVNNGGFEGQLASWTCEGSSSPNKICATGTGWKYEGANGGRVYKSTTATGDWPMLTQVVGTASPGERFCLSARSALGIGGGDPSAIIGIQNAANPAQKTQLRIHGSGGGLLQGYVTYGSSWPAGNVKVYLTSDTSALDVWFDSVALFRCPIPAPTPTLAPIVTSGGDFTSGANLTEGRYIVTLPNPLPSGFSMTYPLNSPPSFTVTVGPNCTKNSIDMVCTNGDITNLNFGVTSNDPIADPWIQTSGGDVHSNININTPGGP